MTCRWIMPGSLITDHSWNGVRERMRRVTGFGWIETVQLYCSMQQSDRGLLLCQINIEVSGAPHSNSISACCLEGGKGRITWELPLSSFILAKLALDSQDIKDYCDSAVADRVRWGDRTIMSLFSCKLTGHLHDNTILSWPIMRSSEICHLRWGLGDTIKILWC